MIGPMGGRQEGTGDSRLRAPAAHRAVAALACPVVGYFVARLLVRLVPSLPAPITYAVCLALAVALGWRAWSARIDLGTKSLRVHNTLVTTTVDRRDVRRVSSSGRLEWRPAGVTTGAAAVGGAARGVVDPRDGADGIRPQPGARSRAGPA